MNAYLFLLFPLSAGAVSSFSHCAGMCGPIHLGLRARLTRPGAVWNYHAGRITSYVSLGLLGGVLGSALHAVDSPVLAKSYIVALAALYLAFAFYFFFRGKPLGGRFISQLFKKTGVEKSFQSMGSRGMFMTGMLAGFLPCPTTHAVLAWTLSLPAFYLGGLGMLVLGLGTLPSFIFLQKMMGLKPFLQYRGVGLALGILFVALAAYQVGAYFFPRELACH